MPKSYRIMHKFWLDVTKDHELDLAGQLAEKKQTRQFTATIRDSLTLFFSLSRGDVSVLLEMFPWVQEKISHDGDNNGSNGPNGDVIKKLDELRRHIVDLRVEKGLPNGLLMDARQSLIFHETEEDETELLEIKKDTSINSGQNLLNSLMAFSQ